MKRIAFIISASNSNMREATIAGVSPMRRRSCEGGGLVTARGAESAQLFSAGCSDLEYEELLLASKAELASCGPELLDRMWVRVIEKGQQGDGDLERALEILARHGAMEATRADALGWADKAKAAVLELPQSDIRDLLHDLADYVVARIS